MKVNVTDFIDFCKQVNSRSYLESQSSNVSPEKEKKSKRPSKDKNLYVAFVGEYSSGKSSLINAILRQNLLKKDILMGTTCAPTFIRYGKDFDIVVKYANGQTSSFKQERPRWSSQDLNFETGPVRDYIDKYTATEIHSAKLDRVTIYLDNPILQNGLVLVDTPSFNANARHTSVTKQILETYCDIAVILTPANSSCSETLLNFLESPLSKLENRCLAIASKIDNVVFMEEQHKIVNFIKQKFKSKFNKLTVDVLPVSSVYSQGQNKYSRQIGLELAEHYKKMFANFEKTLFSLCESVKSQCGLGSQNFAISPEKLDELKQKSEDKNLYLGIVGEFSSGKSTLINAILHQNLLKEDILQGTTCAPTFIQYGKDFDIVVKYANGKTFSFRQEHPGRTSEALNFENGPVRDFIDKYTATEEYSAQLDRVTVYINNPALQNNLVIVDTPGINANARHSSVTKQTLEKYCDAALVLTPTNAICSSVLCDFVTANLSGLEDQCIGIVSQIDKIRRPEKQNELVDTARQKFKTELGKPLAAVLPVSAIYSQGQNENENPIRSDLAKRYKDMFSDFERTIHERLIKGRERILALNMRESVMDAINSLQRVLESSKQSLYKRRRELENNQLSDLDKFIERLIPQYVNFYNGLSDQSEIKQIYNDAVRQIEDNLRQDLYCCQNRDAIKYAINTKLQDHCRAAANTVSYKLSSIQDRYTRWSRESLQDFQNKFAQEFRNLSRNIQISPAQINAVSTITSNIPNVDISFDGETFGKSIGYILSGFALGILGIGIFALIDQAFWNINAAREKAENAARAPLRNFYKDISNLINNTIKNIKNNAFNNTISGITNLVVESKPTIDRIIKEEKEKICQLQSQQDYVENDLRRLHQFELTCTDF